MREREMMMFTKIIFILSPQDLIAYNVSSIKETYIFDRCVCYTLINRQIDRKKIDKYIPRKTDGYIFLAYLNDEKVNDLDYVEELVEWVVEATYETHQALHLTLHTLKQASMMNQRPADTSKPSRLRDIIRAASASQ